MSNQMARAADIIATMGTSGWREIEEEMDAVVQEFKDSLWNCNDDALVLRRQHEAHAANVFIGRLRERLEEATQADVPVDFQPIAY